MDRYHHIGFFLGKSSVVDGTWTLYKIQLHKCGVVWIHDQRAYVNLGDFIGKIFYHDMRG